MSVADYSELQAQLGPEEGITAAASRELYAGDKWFAARTPDFVAAPKSPERVAAVLQWAHQKGVPVTPRGAGYGYVGGCVPSQGGLVLSLEHLNQLHSVSAADFVAVVGPAVLTKDFQDAAEAQGLFYPPDPASRESCSIGGNIATNAGGPRCLKYGVTRDYVLGLQVALADGSLVRLGSRTHKNKTGFDLSRFFVGSEGMLGVVTEATLKLLPLPQYRCGLSVGFTSMADAAEGIRQVFANGFLPAALEVADAFTLAAAEKRTGNPLFKGCHAHLIMELDGREASVRSEIAELRAVLETLQPLFVRDAIGPEACEDLWRLRREFSYSLRDTGLRKLNEDIVVPRGSLEALFEFTAGLQERCGFPVACFGHAGDGNIHVNVMIDDNDPAQVERSDEVLDELFQWVLAQGGVVTGEHGIGLAKKRWWPNAASEGVQDLHLRVKRALDPKGILNPGKFLD